MAVKHERRIGELENELLKALQRIAELEASNAELEQAAHEDPLTAIYNRRGFERGLQAIKDIVGRNKSKFKYPEPVYVVVDLDFFKQVNDQFGHHQGDAILRQFAALLRSQIRGYDIVGRFGGEEFIIALSDISLEEAKVKAEGIAQAVRNHHFEVNGSDHLHLSASFGVGDSAETADKALYKAKQAGRDRVEVA